MSEVGSSGPGEPGAGRAKRPRLVVVGNGMAGARAVEEILARAPDMFEVHMFGDEPYGNYNRILLSNLLAEGRDPDEEIFLNPMAWYLENSITLHAGVRVVRIDRFAKLVYADNGSITPYDKLILATGSRPFFPPMEGLWADDRTLTPGVFGFRTLDDTMAMLRYARDHRRAVVVGGGLLGLEAARGLQSHGVEVEVVQSAPVLMNQQLDTQAGRILRSSMHRLGIKVHTGVRMNAVLHDEKGAGRTAGRRAPGEAEGSQAAMNRVTGVRFADGTTIDCDMVVVTAGIRPNVGLGAASGLTIERAIVVDDQMRSVDEDIYAVGECCQHRGEVYGLVAPLWEQATVLADHITGHNPKAAYHGSRLATKLKVAGVDVVTMGLKEPEREDDEFIQFAEPKRGVYKTVVIRDGTLVGATLLGDTSKAAFLTHAFGQRVPLPEDRLNLLFELGAPGAQTSCEWASSTSGPW
jgi:nitrite reductase (NADH) large subunit